MCPRSRLYAKRGDLAAGRAVVALVFLYNGFYNIGCNPLPYASVYYCRAIAFSLKPANGHLVMLSRSCHTASVQRGWHLRLLLTLLKVFWGNGQIPSLWMLWDGNSISSIPHCKYLKTIHVNRLWADHLGISVILPIVSCSSCSLSTLHSPKQKVGERLMQFIFGHADADCLRPHS